MLDARTVKYCFRMPASEPKTQPSKTAVLGDYIVYVDESGDHSLSQVNPDYPIFVLAFCLFKISDYTHEIVPALHALKFKFFGHDLNIFHEREIRKSLGPFKILFNREVRREFFTRLNALIEQAKFTIVACVIKKYEYRLTGYVNDSPYRVAMEFGLGRVFYQLQAEGQRGKKTFVIFESRGKNEDAELELEFRRLMDCTRIIGMAETFEFLTASKKSNSTGLQLADLVARPIGLHVWKPEQANRAVGILMSKVRKSSQGETNGWEIKVLP